MDINYRRKLFGEKLFDTLGNEALFIKAVKENCTYHYKKSAAYKKILDYMNFTPDKIKSMEDIGQLPFLPTLLFKNHKLFSMPTYFMPIKATSSGTKGNYSTIGFEISGLFHGLKMILKIGSWRKLFSIIPTNYIILGYKPHKTNQTAATKTAFGATCFSPAINRTYALKYENGSYRTDFDSVIQAILKYSQKKLPTRLLGFPSYTYFVLKMMDERGISIQLRKGSKILLGGGWKEFYTEQVDKKVLYDLAKRVLGIREEDIIEFFSAVEHPILYCACERHHFHVPSYSRVVIRDVQTLKPVKNGEIGLVNFITPMLKATPILSVMTDDLGALHDGKTCGCGIDAPYFEVIGRIGNTGIQTCAAKASTLIGDKL